MLNKGNRHKIDGSLNQAQVYALVPFANAALEQFQQVLIPPTPTFTALAYDPNLNTLIITGTGFDTEATASSYLDITKLQIKLNNSTTKTGATTWVNSGSVTIVSDTEIRIELTAIGAAALEVSTLGGSTGSTFENWQLSSGFIVGTTASKSYESTLTQTNSLQFVPNVDIDKNAPGYGLDDLRFVEEGHIGSNVEYLAIDGQGGIPLTRGGFKVENLDSDNLASLTVTLTNAKDGDQLYLLSGDNYTAGGTPANGTITVSGVELSYQIDTTGSLVDGTAQIVLTVTPAAGYESQVSNTIMEGVLNEIYFNNVTDNPDVENRIVTFSLTDVEGYTTLLPSEATINIYQANDKPVITLANTAGTYTETAGVDDGGNDVPLGFDISVTDADIGAELQYIKLSFGTSAIKDGAAEQLRIDGATAGDSIALDSIGPVTLAGVTYLVQAAVNGGTSTLTFTKDGGGNLTLSEGEALLDALRYNNTSDTPTQGDRQFSFVMKDTYTDPLDGDISIESDPVSFTVTVQGTPIGTPTIDLLPTSDTGTSATDNLTKETNPTIRVSLPNSGELAEAGDTLTIEDKDGNGTIVFADTITLTPGHIAAGYVDYASPFLEDGTHEFSATVTEAGANGLTSGAAELTVTIDTLIPVVTSITVADDALKAGESSLVTITFSQAVSNFDNSDLTIANGTLTAVSSEDGGVTWTATFTPDVDVEDTSNLITLADASVADAAGNLNSGSSDSNNYAIDTKLPTATIAVADDALKAGESSLVTITFSEAVSNFDNSDLAIANGTLTAVSSEDGGVTWTATFTPDVDVEDASNLITLADASVADAAGNNNSGATDSNNYAIDTLIPVVTSITVADDALKAGESSLVTITFSQAVSNFDNSDLTIANGTLTAVSSEDGGVTWTATFTPDVDVEDTSNLITLADASVADAAGNLNSGSSDSNNYAIDTKLPTATIAVADDALKAGESSLVTITFSEAVSNFDNSDLAIANGTLTAVSSEDGGVTWTATFTPDVDVEDTSNLITLADASVADAAGNNNSGATDSNNYAIDTLIPVVTSITVADDALKAGESSLVTITFSQAVSNFDNSDLTIANGTLTAVSSEDGGVTWTATFTPDVDVEDTSNLITLADASVADAAGNLNSGSSDSNNYAIDTKLPTATIAVADDALKAGESSLVTITFSEAVSNFDNSDLTIANGTLTAVSSEDGGVTWTATFTPDVDVEDASNLITLADASVADAAGNNNSGATDSNNYAIDTLIPVVTSITVADDALKAGESSLVTITFSEAVSNFDNSDLTIANGTLTAVSSEDGGVTWTATFTPDVDVEDTSNLITLADASVADAAGNLNSGSSDSNNYAIDTKLPTATIAVADDALKAGESSLVTITFSEAVSNFDNSDLAIANGTLTAVSSEDGGVTWTATFTPDVDVEDASNLITLADASVADAAGNNNSGATDSNNYAIDTLIPVVTSITVADDALKAGESSLVTITFSQAVSNFDNSDLTIANGTLTAVSSEDGGVTWTATFTPDVDVEDTSNLITLADASVADAAGNLNSGSSDSNNYAIDTKLPTATIAVADDALKAGESSLVTITFSEAVSNFDNSDLTIANGTLTAVSSEDGGVTWTATFTPDVDVEDTSNLITLADASVADAAGNLNSGSSDSNNYAIDTKLPTATIAVADDALKAGESSLVTITFSEAVSNFDNSDLAIANGTLTAVSSEDGGVTWTATFTPDVDVEDASNLITLADASVADAAGNNNSGATDSNNYAIDTLIPVVTSITVADDALKAGESSLVTITFSQAVSNFDNSDLTIANGTLTAVSSEDGGVTWTATFTPDVDVEDTSNLITLADASVADAAGNLNSGSSDSNNYAIDTKLPTATIAVADDALKAGESSLVTITFSEAVSNFDNSDLAIANGTLTAVSSEDGGVTWTATFTPDVDVEDASNLITLADASVADAAGNNNSGATDSNNYAIDTLIPVVTSITVADDALKAGESSLVTITFSQAVSNFDNSDLTIANGTLTAVSSEDGGVTWTATFTPDVDVEDTSNLITLADASVADAAGNLNSGSSDSNNYAIDTKLPTATIAVADDALKAGESSLVTITFSEAVSNFDNSDLTIANGTLTAVSSEDGGVTWTATFTPDVDVEDASNLITLADASVADAAGNNNSGATDSNNYAIDTLIPVVTSITVADDALKAGESSLVTITFSEAVSNFDNSDLTIANGTLTAVSSEDGGVTWTATFTPDVDVEDTSNLITLADASVADAAGNNNSGATDSNNYAIDTLIPVVTSITVADDALKAGESSLVTITFSQAVSNFDNSDLTIANGTLTAVSSEDGGVTWTATFTPDVDVEDTSNLITLADASVADAAGNLNSGSSDSNNYAIDTKLPTATIAVADDALKAGESSLVTITFSEAVSNFDNSDLTIANGTLTAVSSEDGGVTWTATFTPDVDVEDASNLITLADASVADAAGNNNSGATDSNNYAIDTLIPVVTSITVADDALKAGESSLVTITFSEAVSNFDNSDLTIANGTLTAVSSEDGGVTWTATFTPDVDVEDTSNLITLADASVADAAGNLNSGSSDSNNYAIDTKLPTATIAVADDALKAGESSLVTITFSEAVSNFDNSDLAIANGTLTAVSSEDGGVTWTATFTPDVDVEDTSNLITLADASVADAAGNNNSGATDSNNYAIDTLIPVVTSITVADDALKAGESSLVTITFSEAVSNFDNSDLAIANGTLTAVSSEDGGVTWTATFTPDVDVEDASNLITLADASVADAAGNNNSGATDSNNYAIDTLIPVVTSITVADDALKAGESSLVTITFSQAVSNFDNSDLTIANGTLTAVSSEDGGVTWTATFTPDVDVEDTSNLITLADASVADAAGNLNSGSSDSNNYAIDTKLPTATIAVADDALKAGESSLVTITFSEAVSNFDNSDLAIANGTLTAVSSEDGGVTWTATFTPDVDVEDASNLITLADASVADAAGNNNSGATDSNNYAIDTLIPVVTSITVADDALKAGESSLVTITFSQAVSNFDNSDLTIANGTLTAVSSEDGGVTWTATFTPDVDVEDTSNLITLADASVADAAGNLNSGSSDSNNYAIDTKLPTATIAVADDALKAGESSLVTITFSEAVSNFDNSDLTIANGTLTAVSSEDGGVTWTATFTPDVDVEDASNLITLADASVADAAGNNNSGATDSNNYAIDTLIPVVTSITVADDALKAGESSLVTITFSEAVSNFDNSDLAIANGTLTAVSSEDGGVTWTATFTPDVDVEDTSNLITLADASVADAAGNNNSGATDSNNYAIDTLIPVVTSITVADDALKAGESSLVTITFSQAVSNFDNSDLTIANGTLTAVSSEDGGVTWTATFTPDVDVEDTSNLITLADASVADAAGNLNSGSSDSNNYAIDTKLPTATIAVADDALKAGESSLVTITFSEAVSNFDNSDLTIANGTLTAVSSEDGGVTWTATFTPDVDVEDASNLITLADASVADAAGNNNSGATDSNNYAIDTLIPVVTSITVADDALKAGESSLVTITFSEAVSNFDNSDLTIANGTLTAVSSEDGGVTWTATFTPDVDVEDASNLITLADASVADAAGNNNSGATDSNNYAIDTLIPVVTSITVADDALKAGESSLVTITFSEAVSNFDNSDLAIANGTLTAVSSEDGGVTWTATFTPDVDVEDTSNLITLADASVADAAGNNNSGATDSNNYAIDTLIPVVTSITVADDALKAGESSLVTITFSEAVSNFDNSDLTIANGTLTAVSSEDGGVTWTATFTPDVDVEDTSNLITLADASVADAAGNNNSGATDSNNYAIDTLIPVVTSITVADDALKAGESSLVTITFSQAVSNFDNSDLTIANGTLTAVSSEDGGVTWTATFTPDVDVEDTSNLITLADASVADAAGNLNSGSSDSNNYAIDTKLPTATIAVADDALKAGESSLVTITFSEAVSNFDNSDLTIANGTLTAVSSEDGGVTWTATFTPDVDVEDASNLITLADASVADAAGNNNSGATDSNNYAIDTLIPVVTSITVADDALKAGESSLVTITFSEAVSNFDNSDLAIANGTLTAVSSEDGGVTWTATFTPDVDVEDTSNLITLADASVADAAGNNNSGATDSNNYAIDTLIPVVTSITVADDALKAGESSLVTITFSEAVSNFDNSDLTIANGTLTAVSSEDGGVTWTATFTPDVDVEDTSNLITLADASVADAAGNNNSGATDSNNYAIDTLIPVVTSITVADDALKAGESSLVTITFSQAVSNFDNSDLTIANGTLTAVSSEDGGVTWTATFTPDVDVEDTSNLITLADASVADAAGNLNSGSSDSNNYAIDTKLPTATIAVADDALKAGESSLVTITFSEAVSNFDNSDLTIANGTLTAVSSEDGGVTWTATFTPDVDVEDASNLITLADASVADAAGNNNSGATDSNNYAIDTLIPVVTSITVADDALKAGESSLVTITFSEAVSNFDNSDLTIANGTLTAVSSEDGGVTWTATFTPDVDVEDASNLITLADASVADAAGNNNSGATDSNNYAIDTLIPVVTSITVADDALKAGESSLVTITFSEAVSNFDNSDLTIANGTLTAVSSEDGGVTWTATFTPDVDVEDTSNLITLADASVADAAGNLNSGSSDSNNYAIDTLLPTATITLDDTVLRTGDIANVTITFSEAVSGFDLSDLNYENGTIDNLSSAVDNNDGTFSYTATFTPDAGTEDNSNAITLAAGSVFDAAGNGNSEASSDNFEIDTLLDTVIDGDLTGEVYEKGGYDGQKIADRNNNYELVAHGDDPGYFTASGVLTLQNVQPGWNSFSTEYFTYNGEVADANGYSIEYLNTVTGNYDDLTVGVVTLSGSFATVTGLYGNLIFNTDNGEWNYFIDNDRIVTQQLSSENNPFEVFSVKSKDGEAEQWIQIDVTSADDQGVFETISEGSVTEDTDVQATYTVFNESIGEGYDLTDVLVKTGTIGLTSVQSTLIEPQWDVSYDDNGDMLSVFSIDEQGNWTYAVKNDREVIQNLVPVAPGSEMQAIFTINPQILPDDPGTAGAFGTVKISILGKFDKPELTGDQADLDDGTEDQNYTVTAADLLQGWSTDFGSIHVGAVTATTDTGNELEVTKVGDSWTIAAEADFFGDVTIAYTVLDDYDNSAEGTLTFAVDNVNDAPVASADTLAAEEDTPVTFSKADLLSNDSDVDNNYLAGVIDTLYIDSVTSVTGGTVSLDGNGDVVFTPSVNFHGEASFSYVVADGKGGYSESQTVAVNVVSVNDDPTNVRLAGKTPTYGNAVQNVRAVIADLSVADADTGEGSQYNYSLSGADGLFKVDNSAKTLSVGNTALIAGATYNFTLVASLNGDTISEEYTYRNGTASSSTSNGIDLVTLGDSTNNIYYALSGNDTVTGGSLEDLLFGQDGNDVLSGGAGNDDIQGGSGNDILTGGSGADVLTGGGKTTVGNGGYDQFRYMDKAVNWAGLDGNGLDTILDFKGNSTILKGASSTGLINGDVLTFKLSELTGDVTGLVSGSSAGKWYTLGSDGLASNVDGHATTAKAQFVYNSSTHVLSYDADGSGAGSAVEITSLVGVDQLLNTHIVIQG
ncbi:Ig-like domain-containing protein [Nitrosomonas sp. Is35]|uniref:beta strand repeat-containing protein n=1 Tax=Nitrosomonas sp. Is35 TaxID=3080534 RepID=UPI00294B1BC2|nr:Ig-like domain-containing protein [Nitrosomonas sp. Is35]MDV6348362.1 Ig-like domain-containing protein [Nitrosomonas sp. Is35]